MGRAIVATVGPETRPSVDGAPLSEEQTIAREFSLEGQGLHSGASSRVTLRPAPVGHGVVFVRTGSMPPDRIPARVECVASTRNATTLASGGAEVSTVEHLLAALWAAGIDDVEIDVEGPEVPVLDGSAQPFAAALRKAGSRSSGRLRRQWTVTREVEVCLGDCRIRAEPADRLSLSYTVDYSHPAIGRQEIALDAISPEIFESELAPARTFGFLSDVEALRAAGLARGASLENTLVLDDRGILNPDGLRFPDEFVRHKVVDLLGDLSLLGGPLCARVSVERGGHALHRALVLALCEEPGAGEWTAGEAAPAGSVA